MKRILIIGGTSKLGGKLIKKFIANKNYIYFTYYRNIKKAKLIESNHNKKNFEVCKKIKINLKDKNQIKKIKYLIQKNNFDIILNNAASVPERKNFTKITIKKLKECFEINFFSYFYLLQQILNIKGLNNNLIIINVTSNVVKTGGKFLTHYSTSKSALSTLTKALSREFGKIKFLNISFPKIYYNCKSNKDGINYIKIINKINFIIKNRKKINSGSTIFIK